MTPAETIEHEGHAGTLLRVREAALGFVYWLVFLLVLEPGNIFGDVHGQLHWTPEILRIAGASALGAVATPFLLAQVRRFPIDGRDAWRNAAIQIAGGALMAAGLIAISCVFAVWLLPSEHRPFALALREEFVVNWPLVAFAVAGLLAIAHAVRFFRQSRERADAAGTADYLTRVSVKTNGRVIFVELDNVDWIEAQGNYLALHTAGAVHLIRESLGRFEARLDPAKFSRIHRSIIVAAGSVREMTPLGSGDAMLRLKDGTELRLSRNFRDRLRMPATYPSYPSTGQS